MSIVEKFQKISSQRKAIPRCDRKKNAS